MKCRTSNFIKYWIPPIIYELIIFYLSSRESPKIIPRIPNIDKLYHAIIYSLFTLLLWRAFYYASPALFKKGAPVFAFILTICFALSDEWHQSFVPFRDASIYDIVFDSIGAVITAAGLYLWNSKKEKVTNLD